MSLGTSNRDGGKTSESGHLRALAKLVTGDILAGLVVSQRGAGANMSVDVAIGDAFVRRSVLNLLGKSRTSRKGLEDVREPRRQRQR